MSAATKAVSLAGHLHTQMKCTGCLIAAGDGKIQQHGCGFMQADRLQTQAELQAAQVRSKSLAEDLALIRSTLVPLLTAPATAAAAAAGAVAPQQSSNGAMAALAHLYEQKEREQQHQLQHTVSAGPSHPATTDYACRSGYASPKLAARAFSAGVRSSPCNSAAQQPGYQSPGRAIAPDPSREVQQGWLFQSPKPSPAIAVASCRSGLGSASRSPAAAATGTFNGTPDSCRGGGLAGLLSGLQDDVDKLQQQLHQSRRQLNWDGNTDPGMASDR